MVGADVKLRVVKLGKSSFRGGEGINVGSGVRPCEGFGVGDRDDEGRDVSFNVGFSVGDDEGRDVGFPVGSGV